MGMLGDIGGVVGGLFGAGDKKAGMEQQLANYQLGLSQLRNTREEAGPSASENITVNPALATAQMGALGAMQGEAAQGGMSAQSRAALQQTMDQTSQQERGQREAIQQNAAARGAASGGASLAAQMAGQQGAANRNAMAGTQQVADARQRALQSMMGAGQLGGQISGQQFGQQSDIAKAKDAISSFNAGQRLNKAQGVNTAYTGMGDLYNKQGQQKAADAAALGSALGGIAGGAAGMATGMPFF
ncbi:MAG: hypothetical protein WCO52_06520 [bacterium]